MDKIPIKASVKEDSIKVKVLIKGQIRASDKIPIKVSAKEDSIKDQIKASVKIPIKVLAKEDSIKAKVLIKARTKEVGTKDRIKEDGIKVAGTKIHSNMVGLIQIK